MLRWSFYRISGPRLDFRTGAGSSHDNGTILMNHLRALLPLLSVAAACTPMAGSLEPMEPVRMNLQHSIIPMPASVELVPTERFTLTTGTRVIADGPSPEVARIGEYLAAILRPSTGYPLPVVTTAPAQAAPAIILRVAQTGESLGEEGYGLRIFSDSVVLTANQPAGLFRGVQTIRQLFSPKIEAELHAGAKGPWTIPTGVITDRPRFAWRGAMLDVARHFFTVDEVKQYIDALALYKINVLHLHLSDDQGWRIAIESRPRLTAVGGTTQVGGGPGGFYTQQEYADIVRYAQERYITVIPEIDMPGHTNAALVAYPELSCGTRPPAVYTGTDVGFSTFCVDKEGTYELIEDVIRELAALTPGPYLHVGGDEVEALTPEQYARFIERVEKMVIRHGKRMVGWEEVAHAKLHPSSVVQQWKSESAAVALQQGVKLVLSPASKVYLDMKYDSTTELGLNWAGYAEVRDAYDWDPVAYISGASEGDILGVEAPLWSETIENLSAAQYLAFPRLPAVAEVGWSPAAATEWESFRRRLAAHAPRWRLLGINYYRSPQVPWLD